ncbi:MAG: protease pro-enzyme activation domain-containing protein [Acidobacteriaceae bacterium]
MAIIQVLQRTIRPFICLGLLSASTWSFGAVSVPQAAVPQITQAVNNRQRITLKGNVRPMPRRARDLGAVDINAPAGRVLLLLKRPAEQETALQQFIQDVHTPGSASYHHWLTPAQLGSQFGPAESDVQAVIAWLQSQGFAVAKVSQARTTIEFSGTAGQIESAFATKIHSFQIDGVSHIANIADPQIPAALAPVVAGISPLNDFRPKPMHTAPVARTLVAAPTSANPHAMTSVARNAQSLSVRSNYTDNSNGSYVVTPADFATIYNTPNQTLNKNYAASKNLTGTGVTIGIAGDSNVDLSNVANYRKLFGLPALTPTVTIDGSDPGTGSGDEVEALLDLEVASAVAPGANLTLYTAQDTTFQSGLILAIQRALDDNAINILNVSFGGCEAYQGTSGNQQILNLWQQAAAQGISVTVSTGDSGSAGCDDGNTELAAAQGLQVNAFASTPYNIAVGGTDFNQDQTNIGLYWNATNSSIGGSALKYIPEIPWNDSTTTIGPLTGNVAFQDTNGDTNIAGAGSGVSGCLTATVDQNGNVSGCTGAYPKPGWQSGFGPASVRETPDVSLFASNGFDFSIWLLCASGIGGDQPGDQDCTTPASGSIENGSYTSYQVVGGTSASSPAFAGVLALVVQNLQSGSTPNVRLGQANYTLYPLSKQHASAFNDVTVGNNSVVCTAGTPDCGTNTFLTGYDAGNGYDLATGLGSVDATQMIQNWSNITFTPTTSSLTVNSSTSPVNIAHGKSVNVGVTVTGSGGTPTGTVALIAGSGATAGAAAVQGAIASPSILTLTNGAASNAAYTYLPGGSYTLAANYAGDGTFAPSASNGIAVTVSPESSTLELAVQDFPSDGTTNSINGGSVPYGSYVSVNAQPVSSALAPSLTNQTYLQPATGTVTFASTPASSLLNRTVNLNSNGFAEIPGQTSLAYPPGTYSITASYSGDASYGASSAPAQTFTISKNNVTIASANGSTSATAVVEIDPADNGLFFNGGVVLPTGTVTLTNASGATVGTGTLAVVNTSNGQAAQATITVTGTATTVSYPGDTNYNSGTAAFTGGGGASFSLSSAPASITIPSGGSAGTTISITPQGGFSGKVAVSCTVTGSGTPPPTCSLAQSSVALSGSAAVTDALTVTTVSSKSAIRTAANPSDRTWYAAGGVALAGILLFGLPGRRRNWQRMLSLLLLVISMGVVGCGGGGGGGGGGTTPAGTYTVTVTATSGSAVQTSTITATVQ